MENETKLSDKQKLAIHYKRMRKYQKAFKDAKLDILCYEIKKIEVNLDIYFDKEKFFNEVRNPRLCLILDE